MASGVVPFGDHEAISHREFPDPPVMQRRSGGVPRRSTSWAASRNVIDPFPTGGWYLATFVNGRDRAPMDVRPEVGRAGLANSVGHERQ